MYAKHRPRHENLTLGGSGGEPKTCTVPKEVQTTFVGTLGFLWGYLEAPKCCPEGFQKGTWKIVTFGVLSRWARKLSTSLGARPPYQNLLIEI